MVAPLIAAAGIGAVGSVISGIAGGKGAKKAAQINAQSQANQIAAAQQNRDYQYNLNAPTIGNGNAADERIAGLLNIGGDTGAAQQGLDAWRNSIGYQDTLNTALRSSSNGSFAGGAGQSGAALQRLQQTGANLANGTQGQYMGYLGGVSAGGANARGLVAGVGQNTVNTMQNAYQVGAQGQTNAVNAGTANTQNLIQNLVNAGQFAYGSSYGNSNPMQQAQKAFAGQTIGPNYWQGW